MRSRSEIEEEIDCQREMLLTVVGIFDEREEGQVEKARQAWEKLHECDPEEWSNRRKQAIVLVTRLNSLRWVLGEEWESEFLFDWMTGVR